MLYNRLVDTGSTGSSSRYLFDQTLGGLALLIIRRLKRR